MKDHTTVISFKRFILCCFLFLVFCFSEFSFSKDLTSEQIKLIESLASPLTEPMTFYRWEWNKNAAESNIKSGEITPEHYQQLQDETRGIVSGKGLYLAESIFSSSELNLSTALIEVEVEQGVRILDIEANIDALTRAGIDSTDIYDLKMNNILVSDFRERIDDWWVLKGSTGVKFKPFSIQNVSFEELFAAKALDWSGRGKYPFNNLDIDSHIKKRVKEALNSPAKIKSLKDAINFFYLGEQYFSPKERQKALNLVLKNAKHLKDSIRLLNPPELNSESNLKKTFLNSATPRQSTAMPLGASSRPNKWQHKRFHNQLLPDERAKLLNHMLDHVSTAQDAVDLMIYNTSQSSPKWGNPLDEKYLKKVAQKAKNYPLKTIKEVNNFLFRVGEYLSPEDVNKIIERAAPLIKKTRDSMGLLNHEFISPANKNRIYERTFPLIENLDDAKNLLSVNPPEELKNKIVDKISHHIRGHFDAIELLSLNLPEESQEKIINKLLRYVHDFDHGANFLQRLRENISPKQKYKFLDHLSSLYHITPYDISQFKQSASKTDFQYFVQAFKKRQSRLNCLEGFLDD